MAEPEDKRRQLIRAGGWAVALVPLLLAFALRLRYALQAEPFVDEPTTLLVAEAIARSGVPTLPSGLFYGNDLPYSYLAGGLVALLGPQLVILRHLSVIASTATVGLVYLAGKRLWSAWAGLWAALLLALNPEAILWGGRARAYSLLGLLVFLAAWLFMAAERSTLGRSGMERSGQRRLALLLLVLAVFVHPEAALLLPALVVGTGLLRGWRWWLRPERLIELILAAAGMGARYWLQIALARGQIGSFETMTGSRPPLELARDWLPRLEGLSPFFLAPDRLPWTILALLALTGTVWQALRRTGTPTTSVELPRGQGPAPGAGGPRKSPIPKWPIGALAPWAGRPRPYNLGRSACLFFSVCLWLVPLQMILFLGGTYQSPRYLNMLLPIFALLAACGLNWIPALLVGPDRHRASLAGLAAAALAIAYLPGAAAASNFREKGYQSALGHVGQHWQPGDRVGTVAPAYSQFVLGRCDFFTLGLEYEEFVYQAGDGRWVDRWLGSPLIRLERELENVLDEAGRLWFITDESRLRQRFDPAFAQMVWQRMELVAKTDQVMVFVTHRAPEPAASHAVDALFGGQVALAGYDLGQKAGQPTDAGWGEVLALPGQPLPLTLYWQAVGPVTAEYTVFVHLLGADGERHAQGDGPPLQGLQPMAHWLAGETLPDRRVLDLPPDLGPGRYRLELGLYTLDGGERLPITDAAGRSLGQALTLDYIRVPAPGETLPSPERRRDSAPERRRDSAPERRRDSVLASDGDQIRLLGYALATDRVEPGGTLGLTLYWQAPARVELDYTVFVHLLDGEDGIVGQGDGPPAGGFYPTSFWDPGEIVVDKHQVSVAADAPTGTYRLAVGLYLLPTGQRLSTGDGDRVILGTVEVKR